MQYRIDFHRGELTLLCSTLGSHKQVKTIGAGSLTHFSDGTVSIEFTTKDDVFDSNLACVLQPWVLKLGLRHQGTLLGAVRGCDSLMKNHVAKLLVRALRAEFLVPFSEEPKSFIAPISAKLLESKMRTFLRMGVDSYPVHWLQHLMMAAQVVGYKKPHDLWFDFYCKLADCLHLMPESEDRMDARLNRPE